MVILYIILSVIALIIIFALTAKIKIFLEYKKYPGEKLYIDYNVTLGGISLSRFIKSAVSKPKKKKIPANTQKSKKAKKPETTDHKSLIQKLKNYAEALSIVKKVYSKNRWFIRRRIFVENVDFHLKFGLNDAASTGIATGAVWSILYGILALVGQIGTLKDHTFEVVPVFTEAGFISQGGIRVRLRMISIISVALRLYLTYIMISKKQK